MTALQRFSGLFLEFDTLRDELIGTWLLHACAKDVHFRTCASDGSSCMRSGRFVEENSHFRMSPANSLRPEQ
jgi:hypothetical protein